MSIKSIDNGFKIMAQRPAVATRPTDAWEHFPRQHCKGTAAGASEARVSNDGSLVLTARASALLDGTHYVEVHVNRASGQIALVPSPTRGDTGYTVSRTVTPKGTLSAGQISAYALTRELGAAPGQKYDVAMRDGAVVLTPQGTVARS